MAEGKDGTKNWSSTQVRRRAGRKKQEQLSLGERRRITQLVACLLLFGVLFIGKGLSVGPLAEVGEAVSGLIHQNTDFRAAFSRVGQSISEGEPFVETFGTLWSDVFGAGQGTQDSDPLTERAGDPNVQPFITYEGPIGPLPQEKPQDQAAEASSQPESQEAGGEETVTPVMGVLTSGFGYRTHPIDGAWKQHDGVDIQADEGTPILAFAAGEVEYIGESPSYGLYLQLRHSDGTESFYAHCSAIGVQTGQAVAAGQEIAKVGSTGNVTGAHLHFELKKDGVRIDPADYIETREK